jgi:Mg-chelatase subunit ChlD
MDISFIHVPCENNDNSGGEENIALKATVLPERNVVGMDSEAGGTTKVCITVTARDLPLQDDRAPVDLVVALDKSGSMSGSKIKLCKKTLLLLLRVLSPRDRFGLVTYSGDAKVEIPVQKMTESNKKACMEKVKKLAAGGGTNISAAIGLCYQEILQIENPNEVQTCFLLTDGQANMGVSSDSGLVELAKNCFVNDTLTLEGTEGAEDSFHAQRGHETTIPFFFKNGTALSHEERAAIAKRKGKCIGCGIKTHNITILRRTPITNQHVDKGVCIRCTPPKTAINTKCKEHNNPISLHCFGYGSNHNSKLLMALSDVVPGGSYYFVENDDNVGSAFGDALGGVLSVVAQSVVVNIAIPHEAKEWGVEIVDVFHDQTTKRENGTVSVHVGDFYAEESRDILLEIKVASSSSGSGSDTVPIPHANITVSYTDTLRKLPVTLEPLTCAIGRGECQTEINPHVHAQWLRIQTTKAMSKADMMAKHNNIQGAQERIQKAKDNVQKGVDLIAAAAASGDESDSDKLMLENLLHDLSELEAGFQSLSTYQVQGQHMARNQVATYTKQRCMASASTEACSSSRSVYENSSKFAMSKSLHAALNNTHDSSGEDSE